MWGAEVLLRGALFTLRGADDRQPCDVDRSSENPFELSGETKPYFGETRRLFG